MFTQYKPALKLEVHGIIILNMEGKQLDGFTFGGSISEALDYVTQHIKPVGGEVISSKVDEYKSFIAVVNNAPLNPDFTSFASNKEDIVLPPEREITIIDKSGMLLFKFNYLGYEKDALKQASNFLMGKASGECILNIEHDNEIHTTITVDGSKLPDTKIKDYTPIETILPKEILYKFNEKVKNNYDFMVTSLRDKLEKAKIPLTMYGSYIDLQNKGKAFEVLDKFCDYYEQIDKNGFSYKPLLGQIEVVMGTNIKDEESASAACFMAIAAIKSMESCLNDLLEEIPKEKPKFV